jgi:hypothetical protein
MLCEYNWFIGRVLMEQHVSACWEAIIGVTVLVLREKYLSGLQETNFCQVYEGQIFARFTRYTFVRFTILAL